MRTVPTTRVVVFCWAFLRLNGMCLGSMDAAGVVPSCERAEPRKRHGATRWPGWPSVSFFRFGRDGA